MEAMLTATLLVLYLFCDFCGINAPIFLMVVYGCLIALFAVLMLRVSLTVWTMVSVFYGGYLAF